MCPRGRISGGGGGTPIYWEKGCAIFLGYFFNWKINFWVYFVAYCGENELSGATKSP